MRIGFFAVGIGNLSKPEILAAAAQEGEEAGFSTLWAAEHVVLLEKFESVYPYARTPSTPSEDLAILNPFVALTYAAAVTKSIRLATGVCLVPEYNSLLLAKLAASLDFVSGGRFVFGTGLGWLKEEYEALGVPWEGRARRYRESIEAMRRVWEDPTSSYAGESLSFSHVRAFPKPAHRIPVIMGGQADAALKRAATYGDGWCGFNITPAETKAHLATLDRFLAENGRTRENFEIFVSPEHTLSADCVQAYEDVGVDELYPAAAFGMSFANLEETRTAIGTMGKQWVR